MVFYLTLRPTWADAQMWVMIVFTVEEPHLVPAKPSTHLTVFGFLRDDRTSQSSVTWDKLKGLQKLKEAKRDLPWGIRDRAALLTPCFKMLTSRTVRECVCCFKPPGL